MKHWSQLDCGHSWVLWWSCVEGFMLMLGFNEALDQLAVATVGDVDEALCVGLE